MRAESSWVRSESARPPRSHEKVPTRTQSAAIERGDAGGLQSVLSATVLKWSETRMDRNMGIMYITYRRDGTVDSVNTTEVRENLAEVLNRVAYGKDRVRITRRGKQLAAVVPIEDLEYLEQMEKEIDIREVKKALVEMKENGTIPWDEVKRELGL